MNKIITLLKKIRDKFVETIFLSTLAMGIYNTIMISFMLVTSNLSKIQQYLPWSQWTIILVLWPMGVIGMVIFSFVMDRVVGYARTYSNIANSRNPQITELVQRVRSIDERLARLEDEKKKDNC